MGPTDTAQEGLAEQFAMLLQAHKDANNWSNTFMAVTVWGNENRRSHMSGYLKAKRGTPERGTVFTITRKLGIPDDETGRLFETAEQGWPVIRAPGIGVERRIVGREGDVVALHGALRAEDQAVVRGQGGMGKTTLARHYLERYAGDYYGIWWLRAETPEGLIADFSALAGHLKAGEHPTDEARARAAVMALAKQEEPWLLIYDNARDFGAIRDWVPDGPRILVTSREGGWRGFAERAVDRLETGPGADLLMAEAERDDDRAGAESLVEALGGLPLALVLAGAWLRDTPGTPFAEYEAEVEAMMETRPDEVGVYDYPDSVFGAVTLSLDRLSENAALLMRVFCYLSPDDLWPGLVTDLAMTERSAVITEEIPEALWTLAKDRAAVERAFAELVRQSLLDRDEEGPGSDPGQPKGGQGLDKPHRLHRLTAAIQRNVDAARHRPAAAALLAAGYPWVEKESWPACARRAPAVAALAEDAPETAAMDYLLNQASIWLHAQRRDDLALTYAEESLRLVEARLGPDHAAVGIACNNLAARYQRKGRLGKAEALVAHALNIADATGAPESTRAIRLNNHGLMVQALANTLHEPARSAKRALAARRYREAVRLGRKHGFEARFIAPWINNLASLRAAEGRWAVAMPLHGRALALRRAALPPDDPDIAESLNNLGSTLLHAGRGRQGYRRAGCLDLLAEALTIFEAAFSDAPNHPNRINTARWLAVAHRVLARREEAITGRMVPDLAVAKDLEAQYGLDEDVIQAMVGDRVEREQVVEAGGEPGPWERSFLRGNA